MIRSRLLVLLVGGLVLAPLVGDADYWVVDTGPGRANAIGGDPIVTDTQFQAAQFRLASDTTIVSIQGWLTYLTILGELPVDVVVYGDDGEVPDTTDVYWAQEFGVPGAIGYPGGWHGVDGILLALDAGTYWVSFELPSASFGTGALPPTPLQELPNYATGVVGSGWDGDDTLNIGLRLAVPEPALVSQLAAGLVGLLVLHRRHRSRHG